MGIKLHLFYFLDEVASLPMEGNVSQGKKMSRWWRVFIIIDEERGHVVLERFLGFNKKCDRNQVHHNDVGALKVPNLDFQPILSTSKF